VIRSHETPLSPPLSPPLPNRADPVLFVVVLALCGLGLVMVYSSSAVLAAQKLGDSRFFLIRDAIWSLLGLTGMAVTMRLDYSFYRRQCYLFLFAATALLLAVLVVGVRINGARRWFHFGPLSFQPAEFAKFALIVFLAHNLSKKADKVREFLIGVVPPLFICGLFCLLLSRQPDLGTAIIVGVTTMAMLFLAGTRVSYLLLAGLSALPFVYHSVVGTPWRLRRILAFLDPWQFRDTVGYQMAASLIAVGSGGTWGQGLGDSRQKLLFLPEAHTDYILAILGEELGFFGVSCVASLYALLVWRGFAIAYRARDLFGTYLAAGITTMFGVQAAFNMGVVLGVLPTKGLTLPFLSFGGSTLVVDLCAMGVLLNISLQEPAPVEKDGKKKHTPARWFGFLHRRKKRRRVPAAPAASAASAVSSTQAGVAS
jgi:cell division protein FtsW